MTETRACQNCKQNFVIEPDDFGFYEKMQVPPPTWCPECRMIRRMNFWNEHNFFKKVEKRTGKELISMYPPEGVNEIYEREYWWSDGWDPKSYGREIDWSRPFLEQVKELAWSMPWPSRSQTRCTNSEYSNNCADMKNCYLCFNADRSEDCMYCVGINQMKSCLDMFRADFCELTYDTQGAFNSYQCFYCTIVVNCRNVWFSYDCEDCSDCFGCVNLRHKQYNIFNKQYTKEEYFAKLKEMNLGSHKAISEFRRRSKELQLMYPRKFMTGMRNQNVSGDYIRNSKNTHATYSANMCENVKYSQSMLMGLKDSYDYTNWGNNAEFMYEVVSCGEDVNNIKFSWECWGGAHDMEYSILCIGSSNMFGSCMVRNGSYCILNKEYSKEEYQALIPKIKKHMSEMPYVDAKGRVYKYGEFFPPEFSFFAANECSIMDFTEMNKERAGQFGLGWREPNPKEYQVTMKADQIPDHISEVADSITQEVIACIECGKGFRIVPGELVFLKRFGLPVPRSCFNCRHQERVSRRRLPVAPPGYPGTCKCAGAKDSRGVYANQLPHAHHGAEKCQNSFMTSYPPDDPHVVYCEPCWQTEVLG